MLKKLLMTGACVALVLSAAVVNVSPAHAALGGPTCPGIDPWVNDGIPSPTCSVYGPPFTVENRREAPVVRTPAYGWNPALCHFVWNRWDTGWNAAGVQLMGVVSAGVRVVIDNGNCTGPNFNVGVLLAVTPGHNGGRGDCGPRAISDGGGAAVASSGWTYECSAPARDWVWGDWNTGYYTVSVMWGAAGGWWVVSSTHQIY